ncbi:hypothetical protein ABFS82_08G144600 [Erythranthe guttata]
MASFNIVRFIFSCLIVAALFVPHECVENNSEKFARVGGDKQLNACGTSICGHGHTCWCCKIDTICYGYEALCIQNCQIPKFPRKIVS